MWISCSTWSSGRNSNILKGEEISLTVACWGNNRISTGRPIIWANKPAIFELVFGSYPSFSTGKFFFGFGLTHTLSSHSYLPVTLLLCGSRLFEERRSLSAPPTQTLSSVSCQDLICTNAFFLTLKRPLLCSKSTYQLTVEKHHKRFELLAISEL